MFSVNVRNIKESVIGKPLETQTFDTDYGPEAKSSFEKENLEKLEVGSLILSDFRDSTGNKFDAMENKYGDISKHMTEIESNISGLAEEFVNSNKNNSKLIETLITKLDKLIE